MQGKTSAPGNRSLWRRIQDVATANPAVTAVVLYAVVTLAALVVAYLAIFSLFATYDDEGTLLITLKAFVHGDPLYKDVWSVYGPFYYELFGGFFSLFGLSVTTDAGRLIVIVLWVGTSLLFGIAAQRITGRLAIGLTAMVASFSALSILTNEPMHPEVLCVALIAALVLVVAGPRRTVAAGAICGALLAALVLTKVNLGVFAIAAFAVAAVLTVEPLHRRGWLRWIAMIAFLVLPLVILERDFKVSWVREFLLLEVLAGIAVLVASRPLWSVRDEDDEGMMRWIVAVIGGFLVAAVAILVIIVATGPSPHDVYDGVVKEALNLRNGISQALIFPPNAAVDWGIAAVAAAALAARLRLFGGAGTAARPPLVPGLLRAAVGLTILFTVAHITVLGLNPSAGNPIVLPMVLAWVVAIPPAGAREAPDRRFLRLLLPLLALAESLQVYPVAGSQVDIAAFCFVPVGALCLGDALTDLRAWGEARGGVTPANLTATVTALAIALPALFLVNVIALPGINNVYTYHSQAKLHLPGAELLHIPAPQAETYEQLVGLLHKNKCTTMLGYPSLNAFYFWAELEAPRPTLPNAWVYVLNEEQQRQAVREFKASPRPCVIRNEELAAPYLKGLPAPETPLVKYLTNNFEPAYELGGYVFELPKR